MVKLSNQYKQSIDLGKLDFREIYVDDLVNYIIEKIVEQYKKIIEKIVEQYKKGKISKSQAHEIIEDIKNEFVFQIKYNKNF